MVVFQAAVYLFVFWQGGVLSHINQNAVDLLSEQTYDHQQYLENEMTQRWSDLAQSEHIVLETFRTVMQQYDVGPGATLNDMEIQEAMIRAAAPELLYLLYRNQVTGAYLILDGPADTERTGNRAGFYIRDQNLEQNDAAATSLAVMRGSVAAAADLGIPLSGNWSPGFFFHRNRGRRGVLLSSATGLPAGNDGQQRSIRLLESRFSSGRRNCDHLFTAAGIG